MALGEAPVDDAPSAAAPDEHPAPSAPTRHHHGGRPRGVAVAAAPESPPVPKPAPSERPAPAAETPPPAPHPMPAALKAESAASKPALVPAAVGGKSPAATTASRAGLDPARTQAAVRSHLPEVQRCYERGKMDYPELKGRVTLKISVSGTGAVTAAAVESSTLASTSVRAAS